MLNCQICFSFQTQALALTRPKSQFSCPTTTQAASPINSLSGATTLPNIPLPFPRSDSPQRKNSYSERINAKSNTLNLALMGSRDNLNSLNSLNSSNSNQSLNCSTPAQQAVNLKLCEGISAATSPLLENGKGGHAGAGVGVAGAGATGCSAPGLAGTVNSLGGGIGAHAHKRSVTSQSPHDFRKDFEHNMENGEYRTIFECIVGSSVQMNIYIYTYIWYSKDWFKKEMSSFQFRSVIDGNTHNTHWL